ncbi:MAG TPA: acyl carrier protein [Candidatus Udaeobacter sp.]|jgi:acyl carrier protein
MTRNYEQVFPEFNRIFCEIMKDDSIQLRYETTAKDVENWDSLNHIQLIVALEKHFEIQFNFAELQKLTNIGEWCVNIVAKLNEKQENL